MRPNTLADLMARTVSTESGCAIWQGATTHNGYGVANLRGVQGRVHRLVWQETHGPIPEGLVVCHACDVRACCNIDHLFLGTQKANLADMVAKGRRRTNAGVLRTDAWRKNASDAAKSRWESMTPAERAELGRAMGASRLGKKRGPYKKKIAA